MLTAQALSDAPAGLQVGPSYFLADADRHRQLPRSPRWPLRLRGPAAAIRSTRWGEIDAAALNSLRSQSALAADATQRQRRRSRDLLAQRWAAATETCPPTRIQSRPAP